MKINKRNWILLHLACHNHRNSVTLYLFLRMRPFFFSFSYAWGICSEENLKTGTWLPSNLFSSLFLIITDTTYNFKSTKRGTCVFTEIPSPLNTVEGLKWGQYVGSPALGAPAVSFSQTLNTSVRSLVCLKNGNVFVLSHNSTVMTVYQARPGQSEERLLWSAVLSWGYMDGCIRVCTSPDSAPVCLMEHHTPDKVKSLDAGNLESQMKFICFFVCFVLFIAVKQMTREQIPPKHPHINFWIFWNSPLLSQRVRQILKS